MGICSESQEIHFLDVEREASFSILLVFGARSDICFERVEI